MTEEQQTAFDYVSSYFEWVGFGNVFHKQLEAGIKSGAEEIKFTPASIKDGDTEIQFKPTVKEKDGEPGFYIFPEYSLTKLVKDKEVLSVDIPHYRKTGLKADEAIKVTNGITLFHSDGYEENSRRMGISALGQKPEEGTKYELVHSREKNFSLGKLLGKEDLRASQDEKNVFIKRLQKGEKVQVTLREKVGDTWQFPKVNLQLKLFLDAEGNHKLDMNVSDQNGKKLRNHVQESKQAKEQTKDLGLQLVTMQLVDKGKDKGQTQGKDKKEDQTQGKRNKRA